MRTPRRRIARWGGIAATLALLLLYAANMPFYSGSTLGPRFAWRMEHGRLALQCGSVGHESFYIALNSEGMRFAPEWGVHAWNDWFVNIPLWAPLIAVVSGTAWAWIAWRRARRAPGACRACAYDLRALADARVCPECGTPIPVQTREA